MMSFRSHFLRSPRCFLARPQHLPPSSAVLNSRLERSFLTSVFKAHAALHVGIAKRTKDGEQNKDKGRRKYCREQQLHKINADDKKDVNHLQAIASAFEEQYNALFTQLSLQKERSEKHLNEVFDEFQVRISKLESKHKQHMECLNVQSDHIHLQEELRCKTTELANVGNLKVKKEQSTGQQSELNDMREELDERVQKLKNREKKLHRQRIDEQKPFICLENWVRKEEPNDECEKVVEQQPEHNYKPREVDIAKNEIAVKGKDEFDDVKRELDKKLNEEENEIEEKLNELDDKKQEIDHEGNLNTEKNKELFQREGDLSYQETVLCNKETRLEGEENDLEGKKQQLVEKEKELEEREKELHDQKGMLDHAGKEVKSRDEELYEKESELDLRQEGLDNKQKALNDTEGEIEEKELELDEKEKDLEERENTLEETEIELNDKKEELDGEARGLGELDLEISLSQDNLRSREYSFAEKHNYSNSRVEVHKEKIEELERTLSSYREKNAILTQRLRDTEDQIKRC